MSGRLFSDSSDRFKLLPPLLWLALAGGPLFSGTPGQNPQKASYRPAWSQTTAALPPEASINAMHTARTMHTASMLNNGSVLLLGGSTGISELSVLASGELWSSEKLIYKATGKLHHARREHQATLLPSGKVLVTGGWAKKALSTAELYDPSSLAFALTGEMTVARGYHTATLLADGNVLIIGGDVSGDKPATAELYDSAAGTFSPLGSLQRVRVSHTATRLNDGRVLIAGGNLTQTEAELYDPATRTFSFTGKLNALRRKHSSLLLPNGKVLITGGILSQQTGDIRLSTAELYDPTKGTFTPTNKDMKDARAEHTSTMLSDGSVLVFGGDSSEIYDPEKEQFKVYVKHKLSIGNHTATDLGQKGVLITGGELTDLNCISYDTMVVNPFRAED